jgi:predicted anti-sigma-YlaC factor YlaD
MNCEECKNLITVSVFGKLTPQEKRQLEDHLRECPECTRIHEKSENLRSLFEEKEEIPLPDKEKSWDIISSKAIQRKDVKTIFFPYKKWAFAASALIVVFLLGFLIGKQVFFPGAGETPPESATLQGYESPVQRYTQ